MRLLYSAAAEIFAYVDKDQICDSACVLVPGVFIFLIATVEFQHYLHNPEGRVCSWEFAVGIVLVAAFLGRSLLQGEFPLFF